MTKCINFVCLGEVSGFHGNRGLFCRRCLKTNSPFVFACKICGNIFTWNNSTHSVPTNIPKYCSIKCRTRGKYLNHGKSWSKLNYKKKNKLREFYKKLSPSLVITQI